MVDIALQLWTEASKMDLLILALIAFMIFGNGANKIRKITKLKKISKLALLNEEECINQEDVVQIQNKSEAIGYDKGCRVTHIREHSTIYEQMCVVETTGETVKSELLDTYDAWLLEQNLDDKTYSTAISYYEEIVNGAIMSATGYLRKWIQRNHLMEMPDLEFMKIYVPDKLLQAKNKLTAYLSHRHITHILLISKEDRKKLNEEKVIPKIVTEFTNMFVEIRQIAEESAEKIKMIKEENTDADQKNIQRLED